MGEWLKDADLELPSWSTENQGWCVEGAKKGFDTEAEARAKTIVFFKNDVSPKCSYLWPNGYGFGR
ncbi:MAG TPA: hypothetical protein ENH19_02040 [Actinobacteria bacterium]|nr:hypothetical protein [Actinomycetes bacterium]HEX21417.1 hypothetical protein [Actinomycetota bacterium]